MEYLFIALACFVGSFLGSYIGSKRNITLSPKAIAKQVKEKLTGAGVEEPSNKAITSWLYHE